MWAPAGSCYAIWENPLFRAPGFLAVSPLEGVLGHAWLLDRGLPMEDPGSRMTMQGVGPWDPFLEARWGPFGYHLGSVLLGVHLGPRLVFFICLGPFLSLFYVFGALFI